MTQPNRPTRYSEVKFWEKVFLQTFSLDIVKPNGTSTEVEIVWSRAAIADAAVLEWRVRWAAPEPEDPPAGETR